MAGYPTDKSVIDQRMASVVQGLRNGLLDAQRVKDWLDTMPDADLIAKGWTATEVAAMKSAFADLSALGKVAGGQQTVTAANDFFFWARKLLGPM